MFRANQKGRTDGKGLRELAKLVFQAVESEVDGIIVACSVYCPFVPLMKNFIEIPIIAVDQSMIVKAVIEGNKIGIIATTAPSAPAAQKQIEKIAEKMGKKVSTEIEIVTEGMKELKDTVKEIQNAGIQKVAVLLENMTAEIAKRAVEYGFTRIIVAGRETSGAVTKGLKYNSFLVGTSIALGVPIMVPLDNIKIRLVLKSGNFGQEDFFNRALEMTKI